MRIGYVLLILSILLVCLWFTYVSVQSKEYYRRCNYVCQPSVWNFHGRGIIAV